MWPVDCGTRLPDSDPVSFPLRLLIRWPAEGGHDVILVHIYIQWFLDREESDGSGTHTL